MKKVLFLLVFLAVSMFAQAQIASGIYWVQFTDKNDSPYSIDNPEAFLSQRALQRRANLGIAIDTYDLPVNPQYLQAVADCGAELINPSKWLNGVSIHTTDANVVEAINALPFVSAVRNCPNDPEAQARKEEWLAREQRHNGTPRALNGYYGGGETQITQLNGQALHDSGFHGEGIVVAVLDGGFQGADTHPCFDNMREEGRFLGTKQFVYGLGSVFSQSNHGTGCLSTMAAYVPNTFVGTAPKASYYLIHTEDGRSENIIEEYNWVSGAEYADSLGVDVCTTSLGYISFDLSQWNHPVSDLDGQTAPMSIGAEIAVSRGMICLNAAGNEGYPWITECCLGVPADAEHVLTIGAVDANGARTWFSSFGPTADGRIKPDVMAMGQATYVADENGGYYTGDGTSFATPVIAGVVTCLRQAKPYASVQEICDAIRACGNRANNPDSYYGYGIPDFSQALEMLDVKDPVEVVSTEILSVFPNPSAGEVHVVLNDVHRAAVAVYDVLGRRLYSLDFNGLNHTTLERYLNTLGSGVYFINAVSDGANQTVKLVVSK